MTDRPSREPVFNVPVPVLIVLLLLAGIHLLRSALPPESDVRILGALAFVPLRLTALVDPAGVAAQLRAWAGADSETGELARFFLSQGRWTVLPTLLTYAFLHGNWTHVGLNAIWLLAFGTPVARRFGPGRFVLFLGVAAVAGALTHWALFRFGPQPLIGASAAVSGCMGAAVRFAFRTPRLSEDHELLPPDESLAATLRDRRGLGFIVIWFLTNALFGAGSTSFGLTDQAVAWQAHVGGFLAGLLLFRWFAPADRGPPGRAEDEEQGAPLAQ